MVKRILLTVFLFYIYSGFHFAIAQSFNTNEPIPRLVLVISVDNMRTDYLTRYWAKFQEGGFKRLVNEGAFFSNARLDLQIQKTSTGTATLFTGVNPSTHGIVDDSWYNHLKNIEEHCITDDYCITVGSDSKEGERSAAKLLMPTIGDILKISSDNQSKVFSVAMNDLSAVLSAGHAADGAYWFDSQNGSMISSSYYIDIFPEWVRQYNERGIAKKYAQLDWNTLLPSQNYEESKGDDYTLEKGYLNFGNTFPYVLKNFYKTTANYQFLKTTPYANALIRDFAINLLINEKLGKGNSIDFLAITFTSMDLENNSFGPLSVEMQDTYLRLDQDIALLLDHLDKALGQGNSLVVLTSSCSSSYPAEYMKEEFNLPVGYFSPESAIALLKSFLNITYGNDNWIEFVSDQQIYFNHELLEKKNIELEAISNTTANFINQFEGIKIALPSSSLASGEKAIGQFASMANSYNFKRSGDVIFQLEKGWQLTYKFKQVRYNDNSNIPLIFHGNDIHRQKILDRVNVVDILPTIFNILRMPFPDQCEGNVLEKLSKK